MSNKTLGIVVAVVLVAGIGGIWAMTRTAGKGSLSYDTVKQANTSNADLSDCKPDFDQNKLKDAVAIQNRTVSLDVQNFGTIEVQLFDKDAPKTVENFLKLTHAGYYDCVTFHRVAKDFVIQGGDPTASGTGGQSAFGKEFADEINLKSELYQQGYKTGYLAMANHGPNTNSSQFFIVLSTKGEEILNRNKAYTIFGKVTAGMDVVTKIGEVDINPSSPADSGDGTPVKPVIIKKAIIK